MTDSTVRVAATLEAKVIRACPVHAECPLECEHRHVEDLGVIARIEKEKA